MYIRMAKGGDEIVSTRGPKFCIGEARVLRPGDDLLFVSTGIMSQRALIVAEALSADGVEAGVVHVPTIKPLDEDQLKDLIAGVPRVVTLEEHQRNGGLGSAIAELMCDSGLARDRQVLRLGFPNIFTEELGSQDLIMEKYGLDTAGILRSILASMDLDIEPQRVIV
jgi:transketolase